MPEIDQAKKKEIPISARWIGPSPASYMVPSAIGEPRVFKKSPAYSFGTKTIPPKVQSTPGPNSFLPTALRTGMERPPAFSIQSRIPVKVQNTENPGPAKYYPKSEFSGNSNLNVGYTIAGRNFAPQKSTGTIPSPADYSTRAASAVVMRSVPAYSISSAHHFKSGTVSPGPAAYAGEEKAFGKLKKSTPSFSFGRKWGKGNTMPLESDDILIDPFDIANADLTVPSPNNYNVVDKSIVKSSPAYSFRSRHSEFKLEVPDT